jgi:hypothetical protein
MQQSMSQFFYLMLDKIYSTISVRRTSRIVMQLFHFVQWSQISRSKLKLLGSFSPFQPTFGLETLNHAGAAYFRN